MKKKLILCLTAMTISAAILGCSKEEVADTNEAQDTSYIEDDESTDSVDDYDEPVYLETDDAATTASLTYNGVTVSLFDDVEDTMTAFGEPTKKDDDSVCMNYYYGDVVQLMYYKGDDETSLSGIYSFEEGATTSEGISVGSSYDDVKKAYGEAPYEEEIEGDIIATYPYSEFMITFTITDDKVSAIAITYGQG